MYSAVAQNKYCEDVQDLLFALWFSTGKLHFCMNLFIGTVMVGIIELGLVDFCAQIGC